MKIAKEIHRRIHLSIRRKRAALHEPVLDKNEVEILKKCINSGFVSTAGKFVEKFEKKIIKLTKSEYAVAVVNGTAALEIALKVSGVKQGDEVLVPSITFVGSANAISFANAMPHFIDSDLSNLGICLDSLEIHLKKISKINSNNELINKYTGRKIKAVIPVHVYGNIINMDRLNYISKRYKLTVIEDAAEAIGSYYKSKHAGTLGTIGIISFNGNKLITTGGGGIILTNKKILADKAKHLSNVSKVDHPWNYYHDSLGWNYRMPNLNAALGCAQINKIKKIISLKRKLAHIYYQNFKNGRDFSIISESENCQSNYWLNIISLTKENTNYRNKILNYLIKKGYQCRPVWEPLHNLPMYRNCPRAKLVNAEKIKKKIIAMPSSPKLVL